MVPLLHSWQTCYGYGANPLIWTIFKISTNYSSNLDGREILFREKDKKKSSSIAPSLLDKDDVYVTLQSTKEEVKRKSTVYTAVKTSVIPRLVRMF